MSLLGHGVLVRGRDPPDLGLYYVILYASSFDIHTLAAWYTSIVTRHFPCLPRRRERSASVKPRSEKKKKKKLAIASKHGQHEDGCRETALREQCTQPHVSTSPEWAPAASPGCGSAPPPAASPPPRWRRRSPVRRGEGCPLLPAPRAWGGERVRRVGERWWQTDRQTEGVSFGAAQKRASARIKVESTTTERLLVGDGAAAQPNLTILLLGSNKRMGKIMQLTSSAWCQIRGTVNDAGWHYQQDDNVLISPHQNVTVLALLQHL